MRGENDILASITADPWMMAVLGAARDLGLPDCWIGAGFVRGKIWDHLHGFVRATPLEDIDVLYFQPEDTSQAAERVIEARLRRALPGQPSHS